MAANNIQNDEKPQQAEKEEKDPIADKKVVSTEKFGLDFGGPQEKSPVPLKWRQLADEMLGADVVVELELPEAGGQRINVYIPKEKSNAHDDYWRTFKQDKRTKELGNSGITGVYNWLLKIRKNLIASGIQLPFYQEINQQKLISVR